MQPPAGIVELDPVEHRLGAVGEDDAVEVEPPLDPPEVARAPGWSTMSCSASSTVEIFPIAAVADCTWP